MYRLKIKDVEDILDGVNCVYKKQTISKST